MSLAAGELNRLILIEQRQAGVNELNQPIPGAWEAWDTRWANVKGPTGMQTIRGGAEGVPVAINTYSFRIRYATDIPTDGMRVNLDGMYFDIVEVRQDFERRQWTDLVCRLGGNDG